MNYAITGSAGNTSKPLIQHLLRDGHKVTVIGRTECHLEKLKQSGALTAIGSVEDVDFLRKAFSGADAVYTMFPPNFTTRDLKGFYEKVGKDYAQAIKANGIKYVVNLSSIGAHLAQGAGPVSGMYRAEQALNTLTDVHIKHLRPAYFNINLMANIDLIKKMGIMGSNFSNTGKQFPISDPADIADAAFEELTRLNFSGHSIRYVASDETDTGEIAAVIGKSIGKPDLKWIKCSDEQVLEGMLEGACQKSLPLTLSR